jgi:uncharacterized protein YndB with AHSA1/START domain/predicted enzyme related to lactoylglutathione lyase
MQGLRTLIFHVDDLSAAKAFYAKVLSKAPYFDQPFYVGFDVEGYELGLQPSEDERKPGAGGATAYLGTTNVEDEVARLVGLGATVASAPHGVGEGIVVATVRDPFGNVLGLIHNPHFAPKWVSAAAGDVSGREIVHEVIVPASRAEVWSWWATTEGVTKWLVEAAKIELRPGGAYEVYFLLDRPEGERGSETCRVLSFLPERMLSFTWNAPPNLVETRFEHTWVVVELADAADGTRVRVTHTGWPASGLAASPQWEATFQYFERAWNGVLQQLVAFARTGKRP